MHRRQLKWSLAPTSLNICKQTQPPFCNPASRRPCDSSRTKIRISSAERALLGSLASKQIYVTRRVRPVKIKRPNEKGLIKNLQPCSGRLWGPRISTTPRQQKGSVWSLKWKSSLTIDRERWGWVVEVWTTLPKYGNVDRPDTLEGFNDSEQATLVTFILLQPPASRLVSKVWYASPSNVTQVTNQTWYSRLATSQTTLNQCSWYSSII